MGAGLSRVRKGRRRPGKAPSEREASRSAGGEQVARAKRWPRVGGDIILELPVSEAHLAPVDEFPVSERQKAAGGSRGGDRVNPRRRCWPGVPRGALPSPAKAALAGGSDGARPEGPRNVGAIARNLGRGDPSSGIGAALRAPTSAGYNGGAARVALREHRAADGYAFNVQVYIRLISRTAQTPSPRSLCASFPRALPPKARG